MDIIALTVLGFVIAGFMLFWFNRHLKSTALLMKENRDVAPLFKQKSAELKYRALLQNFIDQPDTLLQLQQLHARYKDGLIDVEVYHNALDELEQHHPAH